MVSRLVYVGRMFDKIRLHAAGRLPAEYHANLGIGFDARTCTFLGVAYADLRARVLAGGCDEDIVAWAHTQDGPRTDDQANAWNRFMMKIGWRDDRSAFLQDRIAAFGLTGKPVETFFDLNEYDEGRDPVATRAWELKEPRILVLMGVSGSGKTTLGLALSVALGWPFTDADDFHPAANIAKMAAGTPLTDADRAPWLAALREHIDARHSAGESALLSCSALKSAYRDALIADPGVVKLIHLTAHPELLEERLRTRAAHFAPPALLASQLATLEHPTSALVLDSAQPLDALVAQVRRNYGV